MSKDTALYFDPTKDVPRTDPSNRKWREVWDELLFKIMEVQATMDYLNHDTTVEIFAATNQRVRRVLYVTVSTYYYCAPTYHAIARSFMDAMRVGSAENSIFARPMSGNPDALWVDIYDEWMGGFLTTVHNKMVNWMTDEALPNLDTVIRRAMNHEDPYEAQQAATYAQTVQDAIGPNSDPNNILRRPLGLDLAKYSAAFQFMQAQVCGEVRWKPYFISTKRDADPRPAGNGNSTSCCPKDLKCTAPGCGNTTDYTPDGTCDGFYRNCPCVKEEVPPEPVCREDLPCFLCDGMLITGALNGDCSPEHKKYGNCSCTASRNSEVLCVSVPMCKEKYCRGGMLAGAAPLSSLAMCRRGDWSGCDCKPDVGIPGWCPEDPLDCASSKCNGDGEYCTAESAKGCYCKNEDDGGGNPLCDISPFSWICLLGRRLA